MGKKLDKLEERRLRIMKVIMTRHFKDAFNDIGQLILEVEQLVDNEIRLATNREDTSNE